MKSLIQLQMKFYTRAGAFEENAQGLVVTRDQYRYQLQGVDGLINLTLGGNETLYQES